LQSIDNQANALFLAGRTGFAKVHHGLGNIDRRTETTNLAASTAGLGSRAANLAASAAGLGGRAANLAASAAGLGSRAANLAASTAGLGSRAAN
jgi:hypothetical protein